MSSKLHFGHCTKLAFASKSYQKIKNVYENLTRRFFFIGL